MCLDDFLLSRLLHSSDLTNNRVRLFTMSIPNMNEETCKNHFDELGVSELKGIFSDTANRRKYTRNDMVATIFKALRENSWIYDYRVDEQNSKKFRITKTNPNNRRNDRNLCY